MNQTHYPREGAGNWVWAAVQPLLAVFAIYPSRAIQQNWEFIGSIHSNYDGLSHLSSTCAR